MIVAIRIVLSLIALWTLYVFLDFGCYFNWGFTPDSWDFSCVAKDVGIFVGIPLVIALVAGYLKKSKPVFWNVFVGAFFVITALPWVVVLFERWFL